MQTPSIVTAIVLLSAAAVGVADSPQDKAKPACRVPAGARFEFKGPLGERIDANVQQWLLTAPRANPGMINMFRVRDRLPEPDLVEWAGEFVGKFLLSAIQAQRMVRSDELDRTVRSLVQELIATQAGDGYLGPFKKSERLLGRWDLWGHEHVMLALMMYHHDTGDEASLRACVRAADLICKTYLDGSRRVFDAGSQEMNMAVIHAMGRLYRLTGTPRYIEMMRHIEKDWERAGDYFRTGVAGVPFFRIPKPRWESLHDLQGLTELFLITGEDSYRRAFQSHWQTIARFDRHNDGAFSTGEGAIGNPYQNGGIETCCTVAWSVLTADYLQLTSESIAADELEWTMWNAVLGAQHPSGRWWTYDTPMDGARRASAHSIVFQSRPGTPELNCCSVNGPRGLGMLSEWAVLVDDEGPLLNFYGPSRFDFALGDQTPIWLEQETDYPIGGSIHIKVGVKAPSTFNLRLRIPNWSDYTTMKVNGQSIVNQQRAADPMAPRRARSPLTRGGYASIRREWRNGDVIELQLDMSPRHWTGDCEQTGKASLYYGPLLLAFDPHYNEFDAVKLPPMDLANVSLTPVPIGGEFKPIVLFEVKTADGTSMKLCDFATAGAYGNEYRSWLPAKNGRPVTEWLKYAPVHKSTEAVTTDPNGVIVASALDGNGEPTRGKLQTTVSVKTAVDRHGRDAGAVSLNGKDSKIQYELPPLSGVFSVRAWVKVNAFSTKTYQQVFCAWASGSLDPLRISVMGDQLSARIEAGDAYATPGVKIETGQWMHVVVVRSDGKLELFINGELRATGKAPGCTCPVAARNFALGANPNYPGDEYLDGCIDDFVLYARSLSPEEIRKDLDSSR